MNCDYCIDGYYLRIDDNNIKNCFPNIVKVPSNYYTKNNEQNIYYKCYELCGSCDNEGNLFNMNCLSCINNDTYEYDSQNKNCFPKISCKYYYYYNFDEHNSKYKICLPKDAVCPEEFPYEIIETKECVFSCSYENLFNSVCKLSNTNPNISQIKEYYEYEIQNNYFIINQILNGNFEDLTFNGNNIVYQITTTSNQQNKIETKINDGISTIDLADCEDKLKKENLINENISLIILKYDLKTNESITTQIEYEIYNPVTKQKLNLDSCKNTSINIYVPTDIDEELLEVYKDANSQGYDIFDPENKFYKDICTPYTSINGTDIILSDRITDILNNTGSLCEIDCEYNGFDTETKKALCQCSTKVNLTLETTEENFSLKNFKNIHKIFKNSLNYKILQCHKLLHDMKNLLHNYGFYILTIIILIFLVLIIMNFITSKNKLKIICSKIVENRKNYVKKYSNKNDEILLNPFNIDSKNNNKRSSNIYGQPPKKVIKRNQTNNIFFVMKEGKEIPSKNQLLTNSIYKDNKKNKNYKK